MSNLGFFGFCYNVAPAHQILLHLEKRKYQFSIRNRKDSKFDYAFEF
jgi:hypothetical protein